MAKNEYRVEQTSSGFVIMREDKKLPLPYKFSSRQYAEEACKEFNDYGYISECSYFYCHKVAGNRKLKDCKYAYKKWLIENYKKFM